MGLQVNGTSAERVNFNSQAVNYVVKDGKLVWADPRLTLSGPVGYTVVGSPTIVDGVASGFSSSDYVRIADAALDWNNNVEWVVKVETPATYASYNQIVYMAPMFLYVTSTGRLSLMYTSNGNVKYLNAVSSLQTSTTYYIKIVKDTTSFSLYLSSDGITYDLQQTRTDFLPTTTSYVSYGIDGASAYTPWLGSIDLKETYIKVNGELWFYGKNYASQNIAPVPAGYTFGTTTTPSIGYVDMRTQQFTAAPSGSTIGRDN